MYLRDKAYAKINLTLDITAKREDGYHELKSIMHTISLHDNVSINRTQSGKVEFKSNLPYLPCDAKNIAVKAALAFFEYSGIKNCGIAINIRKNIPVGAGMAGGSTNAASVLRLLNKMFGNPLGRDRLCELGKTLGADVPFCIVGGAVLAGGIGERLLAVKRMPQCHIVVCKPPFSVSTKMAYELYDSLKNPFHPDTDGMLSALKSGSIEQICSFLGNGMEQSIFSKKPKIAEIKSEIIKLGAIGALMSGSGSAVFGLYSDIEQADSAYKILKARYKETFLTNPV